MLNKSDDPVHGCSVYNDTGVGGCSHVDGFLCDFPTCSILRDYNENKEGITIKGGEESLKRLGNLIYEGYHNRFVI